MDDMKKAVEDPVILKRFRHFVNSNATDSNVVFVKERGQIRPATRGERRGASGGADAPSTAAASEKVEAVAARP